VIALPLIVLVVPRAAGARPGAMLISIGRSLFAGLVAFAAGRYVAQLDLPIVFQLVGSASTAGLLFVVLSVRSNELRAIRLLSARKTGSVTA
jgi:hypothetical protein